MGGTSLALGCRPRACSSERWSANQRLKVDTETPAQAASSDFNIDFIKTRPSQSPRGKTKSYKWLPRCEEEHFGSKMGFRVSAMSTSERKWASALRARALWKRNGRPRFGGEHSESEMDVRAAGKRTLPAECDMPTQTTCLPSYSPCDRWPARGQGCRWAACARSPSA